MTQPFCIPHAGPLPTPDAAGSTIPPDRQKYVPAGGGRVRGDLPGSGPDLDDVARAADQPLPRNLQRKKDALEKALNIADPQERAEAVSRLYRQGGMDELAELERRGIIKPDQAKELNDVVSERVNNAVDDGVKKTIDNDLPLPCVCQTTPPFRSPAG